MSLIDDLAKKAAEKGPEFWRDKAPGWFDDLMAKAKTGLPEDAALGNDPMLKASRDAAVQALDTLARRKADLLHLGEHGLVVLLARIATGRIDDAARIYLRDSATLDELLAASATSTADMVKRARDREAALAKTLQILKEIGSITARYVLPALLAAI